MNDSPEYKIKRAQDALSRGKLSQAKTILSDIQWHPDATPILREINRKEYDRQQRATSTPRPRRTTTTSEAPRKAQPKQRAGFWNAQVVILGRQAPAVPFYFVAVTIALAYIAFPISIIILGGNPITSILFAVVAYGISMGYIILIWRFFWWLLAIQMVLALASLLFYMTIFTTAITQIERQVQSPGIQQSMDMIDQMMIEMFGSTSP